MSNRNFFIVDDNEIDRFVHVKLLALNNISKNTKEFSGGEEVLMYLQEHSSNPEKLPDIILLDIMMPGMTGFDFLAHYNSLEARLVKKPAIFLLSSSEDEADMKKALENKHVHKLLKKPFSPKAFAQVLESLKL